MYLSRGEKLFHALIHFALILLTLVFVVPFLSVVATSFISEKEYLSRGAFILFPRRISLTGYQLIFDGRMAIVDGYIVTFFRVLVGTTLNLLFTASLAYMLSRRNLPGRTALTFFVFFTMVFNGGLVPTYLTVNALGLVNSIWSLVIPSLVNPWWMLIMRNFFMGIPPEIEEAAIVDGASPAIILVKIILPIASPSIATIGLFYAVWHWNAWFDAMIYIRDSAKLPVMVLLRHIMMLGQMTDTSQVFEEYREVPPGAVLTSALIVVVTVPILVVYPFVQKYFVKGAIVGSIKG